MIRIERLSKSFPGKSGPVRALIDVDLAVKEGEFFVLLGPSGSGKTTLLRCVAGLEKPDSGEIALGSETVFSSQRRRLVPAEERELGMVFQSYAIWPHLTVFDNVALPLTQGRRKLPKPQLRERVMESLRLVEMEGYAERPAPLLSGGQQQRVALARAFAVNPQVLLMDEPLSNLDARLREEVRAKLKSLVGSLGITVLYVTHDQVEAMMLADRIAVMALGKILQIGPPAELYHSPASTQIAEFFGSMNWLAGEAIDGGRVQTEIGMFCLHAYPRLEGRVVLGIRPEDVKLRSLGVHAENEIAGAIRSAIFLGEQWIYEVNVQGKSLLVKMPSDHDRLKGEVLIRLPAEKIVAFPDGGAGNIA